MVNKNIIGGTFEDVSDAVVKPVSDEVGKAIESGVQAVVVGPKQLTPQQLQQKQTDTTNQLTEARRKITWWKSLDEAQKKVREEQKQKQMQTQQVDQQQKQVKQFEITQKKKEDINLQRAKTKTEIRGGVGG
jgi:hypothetical protein